LKIISLHKSLDQLINEAKKNDRQAQKLIFEKYAPKMLGVCRQYVRDNHHAEELMMTGFLKAFSNVQSFTMEGSFEGWIRRIMVNTCLTYLRKKVEIKTTVEEFVFDSASTQNLENTSVEDIQKLIDKLPDGYKLVFNLYAIEGFKHHEIADKLGISVSTSKSQLFKARQFLQKAYANLNQIENRHGRV
jgi:RNA polymerase sigma-70 factor (ECF subfamily)